VEVQEWSLVRRIRGIMDREVGVERDAAGLRAAVAAFEAIRRECGPGPANNAATAGLLIGVAALWRRESRGGHCRIDHPFSNPVGGRSFMTLAEAESTAACLDDDETVAVALAANG
jgi:L-aspartate oxidase